MGARPPSREIRRQKQKKNSTSTAFLYKFHHFPVTALLASSAAPYAASPSSAALTTAGLSAADRIRVHTAFFAPPPAVSTRTGFADPVTKVLVVES